MIDDGWQTNVGDWHLDPAKFPEGDADMQHLVADIRAQSLKPRLWVAPLAAAPGSDLLHDHTDMLLLDKDGAPQHISWWNSFYLCPAYAKTVAYTEDLVRRFIGEWGFAGLKIDGQHLNGVAPCYNPAHHHARPEESVEELQDFFHGDVLTATKIDPQVVMELCPCGTAFSFFNFASMNQAPASDPESSWQVRHKGKTLKALMGPSAAFAGDHVELSDGGDDFASTRRHRCDRLHQVHLAEGSEAQGLLPPHPAARGCCGASGSRSTTSACCRRAPIAASSTTSASTSPRPTWSRSPDGFYYAFYARSWNGPVTLRGLNGGRYRVRDYFNEQRSRRGRSARTPAAALLRALPGARGDAGLMALPASAVF